MEPSDIHHRFTYHPPTPAKGELHEHIRTLHEHLAHNLNDLLPEGREKSLAVTKLEESMMWANASLARSPSKGTAP